MKTNLLNGLLLACLLALTAPGARANEEQDLIATLKSNAGVSQKCAACQRLRVAGTAQSVPVLAALLGEDRVSHAARYALEGMALPEAGDALRQALGKTSGLNQAGLVDSLGCRRDTAAVPLIVPLLAGGDPALAPAAANALGKIGGKDALAALLAARDQASPFLQAIVLESLLKIAEQLLAANDARGALTLYRDLSASKYPSSIRLAAWRGQVLADPAARAKLVSQAITSQDRAQRAVALKVLRELNDPQVAKACLRQWASLPEEAQLAVLDAQLKSGAEALPAIQAATASSYAGIRVAAWQALGNLGNAASIPALAKAAASGEAAERAAARDSLACLRGDGVREALLKYLGSAAPAEQAEVLRALGERGDTQAAGVLLQSAASGPAPARLAALEALRKLAVPRHYLPAARPRRQVQIRRRARSGAKGALRRLPSQP